MIDPYKILGLTQTASISDIKAAYKKLAKKYHPDLNPGNKEAENKFKEINHAYELIGDAEAKAKFDQGETDEQRQQQSGRQRDSYEKSQRTSGRYSSRFHGMDEDIFSSFFGGDGGHGSINLPGEDETFHLEVDFHEAALGGERIITLPNGKKLQIRIPAGIHEGQKLKFRGQGGQGIGNGPNGDAYIQISIKASDVFSREGKDIIAQVPVSFFEALNGARIEVPTLHGKVMLQVPPGVSTGTKLRVKDKGAGVEGERGHHLAVVKVVMPKNPPAELKEAVLKLQESFQYNPRENV